MCRRIKVKTVGEELREMNPLGSFFLAIVVDDREICNGAILSATLTKVRLTIENWCFKIK